MREWYTAAELAAKALPDVPTTVRGVNLTADQDGWRDRRNLAGSPLARRRQGRGGGWEYHYTLLPMRAQQKLVAEDMAERTAGAAPVAANGEGELWSWFDRLPDKRKAIARTRADALDAVQALTRGGIQKHIAVHEVARQKGVAASTIYVWFDLVAGAERKDWLPRLAPRHVGRTATVECDPRAWEALKADYLRREKPSFATCYERVKRIATAQGWTLPSPRTLERRLERDVPKPIATFLREGDDALRRMYPAQERDRTMLHAMEAVNVDGHKWDVFVRWPDGTIARPIMVAIQDLYSNKIVGWRIDRTESSDLIRLAFADVFREFGIPSMCWMDNGRGFAAKAITGGTPNRYRFKVKPEEPTGILVSLGVEVRWTRPYSGQSKPIERAFRDLCDAVAKHPSFEGAYTGNSPEAKPENYGSKAVPLDDFARVVGQGIALHNAREGRNTRVCRRVLSFDQAFAESYAKSIIPVCPPEKLRMLLLAAEQVKADSLNGSVRLLGNRYWSECLHAHIGQPLTLRFDPDALHDGVHVYRLDGVYIGHAECLEAAGFADTDAARAHARKVKAFRRATREAAQIERSLTIEQLAALLPEVEEPELPETKVTRLVVGNLATKPVQQSLAEKEAEHEAFRRDFGAGLRLIRSQNE